MSERALLRAAGVAFIRFRGVVTVVGAGVRESVPNLWGALAVAFR